MRTNTLRFRRHWFVLLACIFLGIPRLEAQIHEAAQRGDVETVSSLIEADPELVNARDGSGRTPLHSAAARNHTGVIAVLLSHGAEIDATDVDSQTALHRAAIYDADAVAILLIKKGADLNIKDSYGRTPLVLCARERGGPSTIKVFLAAGADVDARDRFGDTALGLAAWRGKTEVVDLLLDAGAAMPTEDGPVRDLFQIAASRGLTRLFGGLLEAGGDPSFELSDKGTLLHSAAAGGSTDIVETLEARGLDINKKDVYGWTPLHYASRDGRLGVVKWFVAKGAKKNARTIMGQSPLNVAEEMKHAEIRDYLVAHKADAGPVAFPELKGDYLGQEPPGERPKRFATGIVSSIWGIHSAVAFSPDGNIAMWAPMVKLPDEIYSRGGIMMADRREGRWTLPRWTTFSGDTEGDVPFFSPDGRRVYFISVMSGGGSESGSERIWFVERKGDGWGEPKLVDDVVNDYPQHWQISVDAKQTIYFSSTVADGFGGGDIYSSTFADGHWQEPQNAGDAINTAAGEMTPFISPDGSYLLFSRDGNLYISFRAEDGAWGQVRELDESINSTSYDLCPIVSPDGKYLFFMSQRDGKSHVWWVDAVFIDRMRKGAE